MPTIDELEPLLAAPAEALDVEYKGWLDLRGNDEHRALLAKAAIALANEGGGVIVIGLREERPDLVSEPRPAEIAAYDADLINGIIRRFASPSFHCTLALLRHPRTGHEHAVVQIPGGLGVPAMSKSGTAGNTIRPHLCYMRKPGPESAPPENQADWERLLARCLRNRREDMLDAIRNIVLGGAPAAPALPSAAESQDAFTAAARAAWANLVKDLPDDAPARCPLGRYELDYALLGDFTRPTLAELRDKLELAVAHRRNWPEFWVPTRDEIKPVVVDDTIQCWLGTPEMGERDPGHVDFWRASPEGRMFLLRGYFEDNGGWPGHKIEPGTIIDIRAPVWRVAECLHHARILGRLITPDEDLQVLFRARWYGLAGRRLSSLDTIQSFYMRDDRTSRQNEFAVRETIGVRQIADNLPEIILPLLAPLYERLSFFKLTMDLVRNALAGMRA
jgi:transcriptional regulator with XRE-family HTH domain